MPASATQGGRKNVKIRQNVAWIKNAKTFCASIMPIGCHRCVVWADCEQRYVDFFQCPRYVITQMTIRHRLTALLLLLLTLLLLLETGHSRYAWSRLGGEIMSGHCCYRNKLENYRERFRFEMSD